MLRPFPLSTLSSLSNNRTLMWNLLGVFVLWHVFVGGGCSGEMSNCRSASRLPRGSGHGSRCACTTVGRFDNLGLRRFRSA